MYLFVSGGARTGKSNLIRAIYHTIQLVLRTEGETPDLTTGTAVFNIEGITIYNALLFTTLGGSNKNKKRRHSHHPFSDQKRNTLRSKLSSLCFIIIDEISMVGSDMFLKIDSRLKELFGGPKYFGEISIITFGDMFQIPPVGQSMLFLPTRGEYAALGPSLCAENIKYFELTEIMRQQGDKRFAELLNRLRTGAHTAEDIYRAAENKDI